MEKYTNALKKGRFLLCEPPLSVCRAFGIVLVLDDITYEIH